MPAFYRTYVRESRHRRVKARAARGYLERTVLTEWFDDGWAHAPHCVLRSAEAAARQTGWRGTTPPYRGVGRQPDDMAMYAGMGVGDVNLSQPAAAVVADLVRLL